ncbi:hypothetical protein F4780DRAFT_782091 [Xylariomycetidae sp. FL0641]|nr:hypothetical protein F4780DRAFT_782091 [Xylariomycetidae sp. FL0641]
MKAFKPQLYLALVALLLASLAAPAHASQVPPSAPTPTPFLEGARRPAASMEHAAFPLPATRAAAQAQQRKENGGGSSSSSSSSAAAAAVLGLAACLPPVLKEGHVLRAYCPIRAGGGGEVPHRQSVLDLDRCLANRGGELRAAAGGGFSASCAACDLIGDHHMTLVCRCREGEGTLLPLADTAVLQLDRGVLRCGDQRGHIPSDGTELGGTVLTEVGGTATMPLMTRTQPPTQAAAAGGEGADTKAKPGYFVTVG